MTDTATDTVTCTVTCTGVVAVTHDVTSFTFDPGPALHFLPGQYLTLGFRIDGEPVERCYTISSPPTRPDRVTVTVKRVPGGVVSPWLHDHLRIGDRVAASGPFGRFSTAVHPADRYLFLTAGSGITPAMSMVRALCDAGSAAGVRFVHCARTPDDLIFRDELEALATRCGVLVTLLCETDSPAEVWHGHRGRLDLPTLLRVAPDLLGREVFTCGPAPFMAAVRGMLGDVGVDPTRSHEESFVLGPPAARSDPGEAGSGTTYRVDFRRSGRVVECESDTTILQAAARAGVPLLSSCEEGMCGTCKLALLGGRVDMRHAGGIRPREVARDEFLPCCSTPLDDVVVDA